MGAYVQCFCRHIECEEKGDVKAKLASEDLDCCCKWCISSRVIPASLNATVTRLPPGYPTIWSAEAHWSSCLPHYLPDVRPT